MKIPTGWQVMPILSLLLIVLPSFENHCWPWIAWDPWASEDKKIVWRFNGRTVCTERVTSIGASWCAVARVRIVWPRKTDRFNCDDFASRLIDFIGTGMPRVRKLMKMGKLQKWKQNSIEPLYSWKRNDRIVWNVFIRRHLGIWHSIILPWPRSHMHIARCTRPHTNIQVRVERK